MTDAKRVSREPNDAMAMAGLAECEDLSPMEPLARRIWRAMYDAAPSEPDAAQDQPQAAPTAAEPDVERVEQRPTSFRQCPSCKAMWYHNTPEWHEHNCRWNNTDAPNRAA